MCSLRRPVSPGTLRAAVASGSPPVQLGAGDHRFGRVGSPGPWAPTARRSAPASSAALVRVTLCSPSGRSKQTFCWGGADVNFSSGSGGRAQGQV